MTVVLKAFKYEQDTWSLDCSKPRETEEICAYLYLSSFYLQNKNHNPIKIYDLLKDSYLKFMMSCSDLRKLCLFT